MATTTAKTDELPVTKTDEHPAVTHLRSMLEGIELGVLTGFTLADAIREGASVTDQKIGGWVEGPYACGLGAAYLAAKARGFI
jgi:hypothetical protein